MHCLQLGWHGGKSRGQVVVVYLLACWPHRWLAHMGWKHGLVVQSIREALGGLDCRAALDCCWPSRCRRDARRDPIRTLFECRICLLCTLSMDVMKTGTQLQLAAGSAMTPRSDGGLPES